MTAGHPPRQTLGKENTVSPTKVAPNRNATSPPSARTWWRETGFPLLTLVPVILILGIALGVVLS